MHGVSYNYYAQARYSAVVCYQTFPQDKSARETMSVCVDCYRINEVQVKSFYRLLVMFSWILIRGFAK